jgi:PBSX family phage terminase large subunit
MGQLMGRLSNRKRRPFRLRGNNGLAFRDCVAKELVLSGGAGTGKTVAALLKLLHFGSIYPHARMLIVRKTRVSLTESGLVTWERDILGDGHPIIGPAISRGGRHSYKFPNGSVLVTGGMDRPDKILSTEWDLVYVQECTELSILDWEQLGGRLRAGAGPFDQLFGDCNPTTPTHWLYRRCQSGAAKLYPTAHKDNPRYWDTTTSTWTEAGRRYLGRLNQLTGARRKRFLEGKWEAAEGLVYDNYSPAIHHLESGWTPPHDWPRIWSIDWGYIDPLVILFAARDPEGRLYIYREFYKTKTRVEAAAKWCRELVESGREPLPEAVFVDHDPENAATFQAHSGLSLRMADKGAIDEGIQQAQGLFDTQPDGRPRIAIAPELRCHPADVDLENRGHPTTLLEELTAYQWDTSRPDRPKDQPQDANNHACDALRYLVRGAANVVAADFYDEPTPYPATRLGW